MCCVLCWAWAHQARLGAALAAALVRGVRRRLRHTSSQPTACANLASKDACTLALPRSHHRGLLPPCSPADICGRRRTAPQPAASCQRGAVGPGASGALVHSRGGQGCHTGGWAGWAELGERERGGCWFRCGVPFPALLPALRVAPTQACCHACVPRPGCCAAIPCSPLTLRASDT